MARTHNNNKKPYERPASSRTTSTDGQWVHDKAPNVVPRAVLNTVGKAPGGLNANARTKLVVSNLHYNVTIKDLVDIFGQVGTLVEEPRIKYDRSGRSTGMAFVNYETAAEAGKALRSYDGKIAKGERMTVKYDVPRVPGARRVVSAPGSLADRIQKPPLLQRLAAESATMKTTVKPAKNNNGVSAKAPPNAGSTGPIRNKKPRRSEGGAANAPGAHRKGVPKTQEELDKELDAFMAEDTTASSAPAAAPSAANGDVEMA